MKKSSKLVTTAVSSLLALSAAGASTQALAMEMKMEKCFGVAKAGKNDCQTSYSACAGTSKTDGQGDAWIHVPQGTCDKLVGGSTTAKSS